MYIDKLDHQDHPDHLDHIDDLDHLDHLDSLGLPQDTYFPFHGFPHFPLAIEHTKKTNLQKQCVARDMGGAMSWRPRWGLGAVSGGAIASVVGASR